MLITVAKTPWLPLEVRQFGNEVKLVGQTSNVPYGHVLPGVVVAIASREEVKIEVVPEESKRTTTLIGSSGNNEAIKGFSLVILGSSQCEIRPAKMSTRVLRERNNFGCAEAERTVIRCRKKKLIVLRFLML